MKRKEITHRRESRRQFLKSTLSVGAAGAVSVAATSATASSSSPASEAVEEPKKQGYQLTPHVAAYYKTAMR